ncbi:MAG: TetR/AcrR family transcriptional regulator [Clostridiales bacterium]|nr:TetR/AcrR family transcriptional regulator [Clostridiales bacterium]
MEMNSPNKRKQQANETKKRIYGAATELIHEKGFENVRIEDISKRANVSMGLFYNYFTSKADVLTESFIENTNGLHMRIREEYLLGLRGLEKLEEFIRRVADLRINVYNKEELKQHYINIMLYPERYFKTQDNSAIIAIIVEAIEEAKEDGIIREDAPSEKIAGRVSAIIRGVTLDGLFFKNATSSDLQGPMLDIAMAYVRSFMK